MRTYGDPFRLYLVKDQAAGTRRQLRDRDEARRLATEIHDRTGEPLSSILAESRSWYVVMYLGNGRERRVNTRKATKHEASKWAAAQKGRGSAGPRKESLAVAVEAWLKHHEVNRLAEETIADYRGLTRFWKEALGDFGISDITPEDLTTYFQRRVSGELGRWGDVKAEDRRKPSARLLTKDRTVFKSFLTWAKAEPAVIETFKGFRWKQVKSEPEALTREEVTALLDACRKPYQVRVKRQGHKPYEKDQKYTPPAHLYGIVLTALHSLLRFGNVIGLRWENVNIEKGEIRIRGDEVKTKAALRIPLTPTLRRYFESLPRGAPASPIFPGAMDNVKRSFRSAARRANLPDLKFHTLRATAATLMLDEGVPLPAVQRVGGWATPAVLLRHYAKAMLKGKAQALEVLDGLGG